MMQTTPGNFIRVASDTWTLEESQTGDPFVPFGCNYYEAHSGWPPKLWNRFDRAAVRQNFRMMEDLGVNAVRVWLQWSAFMPARNTLSPRALEQCREILQIAAQSGIRVNLTGPEFWEGLPPWLAPEDIQGYQHYTSPLYQDAHATFWELFAGQVADEEAIYGFDLVNEPFIPWDGDNLRKSWNQWLRGRYDSPLALKKSWGKAFHHHPSAGDVAPPPNRRVPGSRYLIDYQKFREEMAFGWIQKTVRAIRNVDQRHLITVGLHQSGCPLEEIIPSRYTAFNPHRLKDCLDYIALHWYPFGNPLTASCLPYDLPGNRERSLSVFLANCRYHAVGRPLIMEEYSYYGGGSPSFWGGVLPERTEKEQDDFSRRLMKASKGSIGGWLNWPLQDTPGSTDTSAFGGFYSAGGELKPWGRSFRALSARFNRKRLRRRPPDARVPVSSRELLTDWAVCSKILERCYRLHRRGNMWDFQLSD